MRRQFAGVAVAACLAILSPAGARAATDRVPMTGFLAAPTEQLALPGDAASGEITPNGDIYTGWAEYALSIGPRLRPWSQPTRILPMPLIPMFDSQVSRGGVTYVQQVLTAPVAGQPVVYLAVTAHNDTHRAQPAAAALGVEYSGGEPAATTGTVTGAFRYERPPSQAAVAGFFQPGTPFDPRWDYSVTGRDVIRDGVLLARGPVGARSLPTPHSGAPDVLQARQLQTRSLAPGASVSWTWQIPLAPPPAGAAADAALDATGLGTAHARVTALWRGQERGMTRIEVPETRIDDVYDANVAEILQSRLHTSSGWLQAVNRLQYQAYWIRDSSVLTVALDDLGLHTAAGQNLAYLANWQQPDGLYISESGQQDGVGEALWELSGHAVLTHNAAYARAQLAGVTAAVGWIGGVSSHDSLGLLPPSTIQDDEFLSGSHITGDDLWAAVGLRSAIALARLAGRPDLATAWGATDARFERALDSAITRAVATSGHITPGLDATGGYDWGNYWAAFPLPILSPRSRAVQDTIRWFDSQSREGIATWGDGVTLHDYLGFPVFETELEAGQTAAALSGFYAEVAHTTAPGYGWEDGMGPYGFRASPVNMSPHGTFSGQFVTMLRNLLVDDSGAGIDLLGGVSPAWLRPGDHISVTGAPTRYGTVSFALSVAPSGSTVSLHWRRSGPGSGRLSWTLPYWVHHARTPTGGAVSHTVALQGRSGSVTLRWSARPPALSAARATATLNRGYRGHGRPAPIVSAPGWG